MNNYARNHAHEGMTHVDRPSAALTRVELTRVELTWVELTWVEKKIEHWIRFGNFAEEKILDRRRRVVSFSPGSIFAFVRNQLWTRLQ